MTYKRGKMNLKNEKRRALKHAVSYVVCGVRLS